MRVDGLYDCVKLDTMPQQSSFFGLFAKKALYQCVLMVLVVFFLSSTAVAHHPSLHIDYPNYWPFFSRDEDGNMEGFFYDIITEAFIRMDMRASWHEYPWGRCQVNVQCGEASAMISVPTKERLEYTVTHKHSFYMKDLTIFTSIDHPKIKKIEAVTSIEDILRLDLSVVTYVGNGWNDTHIKSRGIKTYQTPRLKNVWQMLANKRADIAIEWPGAAWAHIVSEGVSDKIVQTEVVVASMPFHLLVRKGELFVERLEEFDRIIVEMQEEGLIDEMVRKYVKVGL